MKNKKIFVLALILVSFTLGANYVKATTWLSDAVDDGGFGECHYNQYTSTDTNGDGVTDEITVSVLHGHWSGALCVLTVVEAGADGDELEYNLVNTIWNFVKNVIGSDSKNNVAE